MNDKTTYPYPFCTQKPDLYKPIFQTDNTLNADTACLAVVEYFD